MFVPKLKFCCQMCIIHHIIGNDFGNKTYQQLQEFLLYQLDEGAWGFESQAILNRVVKHHGYFLSSSVILSLLPINTKNLCLKECPALTEECLSAALKRCCNLHILDITENPLLKLSLVNLFGTKNYNNHATLSSVILEDCPQVNDVHIKTLLRNAPNLQHLNIGRCGITDKVFLLDEEIQLAREACLDVDEHFMNGAHLTYTCHLQSVDVSRCSEFSSTGVRHLCTLCGPTLRSVNFSWTKVECSAFLFLSGMGFQSVVEFFMSTGAMPDEMMEKLVYRLHQFTSLCSHIVCKWELDKQKTTKKSDTKEEHSQSPSSSESPKAMFHVSERSVEAAITEFCEKLKISASESSTSNCDGHVDLEKCPSNQWSEKLCDSTFQISCMDDMPKCSPLGVEEKRHCEACEKQADHDLHDLEIGEHCGSEIKGKNPDLSGQDPNGQCNNENDVLNGAEEPSVEGSQEMNTNERILKVDRCDDSQELELNDLVDESNKDECAMSKDNDTLLKIVDKKLNLCEKNSKCVNGNGTDKTELADEKISNMNKKSKGNFFDSNITSIIVNATVFREEILGLYCFQKFLTTNKNLDSLTISSGISGNFLSDSILDLIGSYARGLEYLSVQGSDKLSHTGIIEIAKHCKKLSSLDLTGVSFVGDGGIIPLVNSLSLTHLKLAETRITGKFMNHLAKLPMAGKLKEIDLSWCEEIESNSALNNFIASCPKLEKLMLRECCVSNASFKCISQHSHHITELSLASNMSVMRDEGVMLLTENLPLLIYIDLGWNSYLTNASIHALLRNCHQLEKANLEGLKLITASAFLPLISVPEELYLYLERTREPVMQDQSEGETQCKVELSKLPCLPHRSSLYSTSLLYVNLTYCDFVEDLRLQQIVTITNGGIQMLDYYGNRVEPSKNSLELFLSDYLDSRGEV